MTPTAISSRHVDILVLPFLSAAVCLLTRPRQCRCCVSGSASNGLRCRLQRADRSLLPRPNDQRAISKVCSVLPAFRVYPVTYRLRMANIGCAIHVFSGSLKLLRGMSPAHGSMNSYHNAACQGYFRHLGPGLHPFNSNRHGKRAPDAD